METVPTDLIPAVLRSEDFQYISIDNVDVVNVAAKFNGYNKVLEYFSLLEKEFSTHRQPSCEWLQSSPDMKFPSSCKVLSRISYT